MGAAGDFVTIKAETKAELDKKWHLAVEEALYDHGHEGYSGTIAEKQGPLTIYPDLPIFPTVAIAEDWILDRNEKWGTAMAVRIGENEWLCGGWCST